MSRREAGPVAAKVDADGLLVVEKLGVGEAIAGIETPLRVDRRVEFRLEASRPHLSRLHVDIAGTTECDVLTQDAIHRRPQLQPIAVQAQALADLELRAGFRVERRAVGLRQRGRLERIGERTVDVDARRRLIHEADARGERFGVATHRRPFILDVAVGDRVGVTGAPVDVVAAADQRGQARAQA